MYKNGNGHINLESFTAFVKALKLDLGVGEVPIVYEYLRDTYDGISEQTFNKFLQYTYRI